MAEDSKLVITVDTSNSVVSVKKLDKALDSVERSGEKTSDQFDKMSRRSEKLAQSTQANVGQFRQLAASAAAFVTVGLGASVFNTVKSVQSMKMQLKTLLGTMENANGAFAALQTFASRTPYNLEQSVRAFQKLTALGLEPSERALFSYGNTASAMGKDLDQMIEAVADAATGEFERLKEFGIKSSTQGDQVKFTFQNVTTTVKKNAEDIKNYLIGIGEANFATAMSDQMDSINGQVSNLQDEWSKLKYEIGRGLERSTFLLDIASWIKTVRLAIPVLQIKFRSFRDFLFLQFDSIVAGFKKSMILLGYSTTVVTGTFKLLWAKAIDSVIEMYAGLQSKFADFLRLIPDASGLASSLQASATAARNLATNEQAVVKEMKTAEALAQGRLDAINKDLALKRSSAQATEVEYQKELQLAQTRKAGTKTLDDFVKKTSEEVKKARESKKLAAEAAKIKAKGYQKEIASLDKWLQKKKEEIDLYGKSSFYAERYHLAVAAGKAAVNVQTEAERERIKVLVEQGKQYIAILEAQETTRDLVDEIDGGQRAYNEALKAYNEARRKGYITDQQYLLLLGKLKSENTNLLTSTEQFNQGARDAFKEYKDEATDTYTQTKDVFTNAMGSMEDALVSFVTTGKLNFADFARSVVADITRIYAKKALLSTIEGFGSGGSGGGLGSFIGKLFAASGEVFSGNGDPVQAFATGGTFTNRIVKSPTQFKFADGTGIMGEAGPEAIMPLTRDSKGRLGVQATPESKPQKQVVVQNTIIVQAPEGRLSKESLSQLQAKLGTAMQRSVRRNT